MPSSALCPSKNLQQKSGTRKICETENTALLHACVTVPKLTRVSDVHAREATEQVGVGEGSVSERASYVSERASYVH